MYLYRFLCQYNLLTQNNNKIKILIILYIMEDGIEHSTSILISKIKDMNQDNIIVTKEKPTK